MPIRQDERTLKKAKSRRRLNRRIGAPICAAGEVVQRINACVYFVLDHRQWWKGNQGSDARWEGLVAFKQLDDRDAVEIAVFSVMVLP